ncbi:transcriptional regulatory protein [Kwoniella heveanensis BCC8398]|uniref:Transcriptional regulatory protein n=1 Tax=Kwoniella heveanensis BCC8398 TaxID=1296120 RepID=A0A1B9GS86_9TREE|nr:transcriptional regulatory protein [Kwoniella heveanensis BCC8398]
MNGSMRPPALPLSKASSQGEGSSRSATGAVRIVNGAKGDKEKTGRQSFSCAECRRLKLKCSREWPCTSCEKRGCAQICPNGEMRTGKGKRLILADTAELHQRISLLEVALAQSHSKHSSTPHPLLESPYLFSPRDSVARPYPKPSPREGGSSSTGEDELVQGAFGTLTIGEEGHAKFVGSFAGSEYLRDGEVSDEEGSPPPVADIRLRTPKISSQAVNGFPLVTPPATAAGDWAHQQPWLRSGADPSLALTSALFGTGSEHLNIEDLRAELPNYDLEGRALVESYWENVNWQYQPIPQVMFDNDHIMNAYDLQVPANPHKLACVFLVMGIGAMFDLNRAPFHPRGDQLFRLGQACISSTGIEHASPATVQAFHLMGTFILNDKRGNGAEAFWPILGTAVKIAQSLGLHRDGSHYGLSRYEIEERRQVWWELVTYDRLQALCFGRPCATSDRWSDTKPPEAVDLIGDEDGFHRAKYKLIVMMERVINVQTQTSAVSYTSVMQLDTELREFKKNLPELLMPTTAIQDLPLDRDIEPQLVIHRLGIRLQVAQMRLLLNRPLFARALKDNPDDPSRSKLGPSFIALFESAQEIVQLVKTLVIYHPSLVARWWFFWFHAFSSAVCLSAIVIRAPICAFASPAFHGMSIVCDISAAAREGCRAKKGLPILLRLKKRAHQALVTATRSKNKGMPEGSGEEDDLTHLAGSAKLRRVPAPLHKRAASSPSGPSVIGTTSNNGLAGELTSSPNSAGSVATSATLAEPSMYDGIVPPFPGDPSSMPQHPGPGLSLPLQTSSTWVSEDPINQYINSSVSPSTDPLQGHSATSPGHLHGPSPSGYNVNQVNPEFDMRMGVDMDMSMAFGIERPMGANISMNVPTIGGDVGMTHDRGFDSHPQFHGGGGGVHPGQGNGPIMFSPESEMFQFNFEDFVSQMGGG